MIRRGAAIGPGPKKRLMLNFKLVSLALAALAFSTPASAYAADAEHGRDLARRWCASCHLVTADQQRANADVPPFATIARLPNFNHNRLAHFLLDPHPKIAEIPLSRTAAEDIAAYIETLKLPTVIRAGACHCFGTAGFFDFSSGWPSVENSADNVNIAPVG